MYDLHPDLHSFPTRRSSDLRKGHRLAEYRRIGRRDYGCCGVGLVHDLRSEEHTSELQSLTNLVCRLLLEKKKTIKNLNNKICIMISIPKRSSTCNQLPHNHS